MDPRQDAAQALGAADPLWSGPTPVRRVGLYRVERMLAAGPPESRGTVYLAGLVPGDTHTALKVLRSSAPENVASGNVERGSLDEALAPLGALTAPNLPLRAHGFVETAGGRLPFVAFDYQPDAAGLVRTLHRTGASIQDRLRIADNIAAALESAHGDGVAHGSLTLARVLVTSDAALGVTLLGFDAARLAAWTARSDAKLSATDDVHAFGRMLFELCARRPLLPQEQHAPQPSQVRADVPPALDGVVQRALDGRYTNMRALRSDLVHVLAQTQSPARAWTTRAVASLRRRPLRSAAVLMLGVFAVLALRDAAEEQAAVRSELAQARSKLAELRADKQTARRVAESAPEPVSKPTPRPESKPRMEAAVEVVPVEDGPVEVVLESPWFDSPPLASPPPNTASDRPNPATEDAGAPSEPRVSGEDYLRAAILSGRAAAEASAQRPTPARATSESASSVLERARLLLSDDRRPEAIALLEEALERSSGISAEPAQSIALRSALAGAYADDGALDAATTEFLDVVQDQRGLLGETHADTLRTELRLANILQRSGDTEGALLWLRHATDGLAAGRAEATEAGAPQQELNELFGLLGEPAQAIGAALLAAGAADEAHALLERTLANAPPSEAQLRSQLASLNGRCLLALGRHAEAEEALLGVVRRWDAREPAAGDEPPGEAYRALAQLYGELGRPELAAAYRAR